MKQRNGSRFAWLCGVWLTLLVAAGPAGAATYPVRLGDGPFISGGGMWTARERGYFEKLGVKIEFKKYMDGAFIVAPLLAGELDIGTLTPNAGIFNSVARGGQIVMILDRGREREGRAYVPTNVSQQLADKGLKTLADLHMLKGKKVGVGAPGSINQYLMSRALQKGGLDPRKDVEWIIGVPQPELMKMLCQKQLDATNLAYQLGWLIQKNGCGPLIASGDMIEPDAQIAVYAVRKEFLQNNREAVVRFAMAYLQGAKEFNAAAAEPDKHPDIVATLAKNTFVNTPEMVKAIAPHWAWVAEDGVPNVDNIMAQQDYWADYFNLVERKVSRDQLFDLSVVKEARERLEREKPFRR